MTAWVIDTSSIIDFRQFPHKHRNRVLSALADRVEQGRLFFPPQVHEEVMRFGASVAQAWTRKNSTKATHYRPTYGDIKPILDRVPNLIDHSKTTTEQADPFIIVVAQQLQADGHQPTIITEDRKRQGRKVPLSSAAGVFGFPSVALFVFLDTEAIYSEAE